MTNKDTKAKKPKAEELSETDLNEVTGGFFNTEKGYGFKQTDTKGSLKDDLKSEDESIIMIGEGSVGKK